MADTPKVYNLTNDEIKSIANLCYQEQGSVKGAAAEASLMTNRFELYGENRGYSKLYTYVKDSGWWANSDYWMRNGNADDSVVNAVANVFINGNRTLPDYIDEHDCFSDIRSIDNSYANVYDRSNYVSNVTKIENIYGARYTFYCFPSEYSDPFGYTDAALKLRNQNPKTESKVTVKKIFKIAKNWLGLSGFSGTNHEIVDVYNNHEPLANGYHVSYEDSWCDVFVSAVFIKANATDLIGGTECGVERHVELFKQAGIWEEDGTITPNPGDLIVYNWGAAVQPNNGFADHIGIVYKIKDGMIVTIEGNVSNCVKYCHVGIGSPVIRGFARPKYAQTEPVADAAIHEIALQVIDGKWGNGEERLRRLTEAGYDYHAVQLEVNMILS